MDLDIGRFIKQHHLPESYITTANQWFFPLAQQLISLHKSLNRPLVIGVNGSQGSGKSTLSDLLVFLFQHHFDRNAIALSIDDFYLTRQQRRTLADTIHPLLMTRGVPGTHDVSLAIDVINQLVAQQYPVAIPRFNKAIDDRHETVDTLTDPVDIIILEGWCIGALPQSLPELDLSINDLEEKEDPDKIWRHYVNQQLAGEYQRLFGLLDTLVMLKAPSFDSVFNWRLEQEQKLGQKAQREQSAQHHVMTPEQVARFIQFYQRITESSLESLPAKTHFLFELDQQRHIQHLMTRPNPKLEQCLIYTDLDGTLLDHHDYTFDPALPTLTLLEENGIPVIPVSSKTQAEIEVLRSTLNNHHPFIIENGAAIYIPKNYFPNQPEETTLQGDYWVKSFVAPRQTWQGLIKDISAEFKNQFISFADAGIDGIIEMTGLSREAAALAGQRQYGEPIKWLGNPEQKQLFIKTLQSRGANVLEGGRFIHVSGQCDKGLALQWLSAQYQQHHARPIATIALGDSHNDVAMLNSADYAVLIPSPSHALPQLQHTNVFTPQAMGPEGWAEAIEHLLALY